MLYTLLKLSSLLYTACTVYIDTEISSITATGQKRPPPSVGGEEASATGQKRPPPSVGGEEASGKRSRSGVFSVCVACVCV